jgi:hypothetical protein
VAALTPGSEIIKITILGNVIEMSDGEHHPGAGHGMRLAILGATVPVVRRTFAATAGAEQHLIADVFPVSRVALSVFGADRHAEIQPSV